MAYQMTLRSPVMLAGVGLHTGDAIRLSILPAPSNAGLSFRRVDLSPVVDIPARSERVVDTSLATVLARDGASVSTVEHCLAALAGLGVDNAVVEVDGPELPILDGSAGPYVQAILAAGLRAQRAQRQVLRVLKPVRVEAGDKFALLMPAPRFRVTYTIDFEGRLAGSQHYYLDVDPDSFAAELSQARTFGFLQDVQYLRTLGKARGGSLENAVVIDGGKVLNPEGLRMPDEQVRHKILDAVGDLALAGVSIRGHLVAHKAGHGVHLELVKALLARPDAWVVEAAGEELEAAPARWRLGGYRPSYPLVPAHA